VGFPGRPGRVDRLHQRVVELGGRARPPRRRRTHRGGQLLSGRVRRQKQAERPCGGVPRTQNWIIYALPLAWAQLPAAERNRRSA
jgi:hypothetical protein